MSWTPTHYAIHANHQHRKRNVAAILAANRPLYRALLTQARRSLTSKTPQLAVILAHAAAEVCVESALTDLFGRKGVPELEKPVLSPFRSNDLNNGQLRELFNALTGQKIQAQTFWADFKTHAKLRHLIVHRGQDCAASDARRSVEAVRELVSYVTSAVKAVG